MNKVFSYLLILTSYVAFSQSDIDNVLSLKEYIGYVKKFHPIVKQAQLKTTEGEIKLLKARGAFDPKIDVDYNRKKFKSTDYFNKLNATFKIPTWYGLEFKGNYEKNSGVYLNPELTVPEDGLYSAGVSASLARGLLTNERMATLKKAKIYNSQARADQQMLVNDILYEAIITYFDWLKEYEKQNTYTSFLKNAEQRLNNVKRSYDEGDKPAIDTLEANINLNNRILDLEKAKLNYIKSKLKLANYLWLEDNIPLELENDIIPDTNTLNDIDNTLDTTTLNNNQTIVDNHVKVRSLEYKKANLIIDKRLKLNNLLPKVDVEYNFLTSKFGDLSNLDTDNYKAGLNVSIPLFLRKERSDLKLARLKLQDIDFVISANKTNISNKINAVQNEISSYLSQNQILNNLIEDYRVLVKSEEKMFLLGEGSLFRINYREAKLIETELKVIDNYNKYFGAKASLYQIVNNQFTE
ncbi:outer membrane protein TolC [Tenacibaculum skagerrakense]|uniref:Outer membrane protein TolC n=1 Tax=Tenacibaculum skagerrakense TaxID=186571 RepID=A0A4R2NV04_9FLAO|nr:TolC family protein [Tenacibaculum skagerrakense]TCP25923.1 outer membrane protein TolC [Tenacibaculum skagerrakense]